MGPKTHVHCHNRAISCTVQRSIIVSPFSVFLDGAILAISYIIEYGITNSCTPCDSLAISPPPRPCRTYRLRIHGSRIQFWATSPWQHITGFRESKPLWLYELYDPLVLLMTSAGIPTPELAWLYLQTQAKAS